METFTGGQLPYFDCNDLFDAGHLMVAKDLGNLASGTPTYGIFEYVCFLDDTFFNAWMTMSEINSMGLCFGLMSTAFITRLLFVPGNVYSQMVGHKMKLL